MLAQEAGAPVLYCDPGLLSWCGYQGSGNLPRTQGSASLRSQLATAPPMPPKNWQIPHDELGGDTTLRTLAGETATGFTP